MRKTRIVATIGPASRPLLRALIQEGVDVFRINFSHDTRETHREVIRELRKISTDLGREVGILQDLCGPKIRCGEMPPSGATLQTGKEVIITTRPMDGNDKKFSTSYKTLIEDVKPGARILLDDGLIELNVIETLNETELRCRIVTGGVLKSRKGMNMPDSNLSVPSMTEKDILDLQVGLEEEVDFVALSFVRHPNDVSELRRLIDQSGKSTQIVAKIEKPEALDNLDAIIQVTDGIMVARGDLGVEVDIERIAVIQKDIIRRANEADKYVITATQMLDSMIRNPSPTRAEVTDVSNAIIDGTDAVMLSGETAAGDYPLEAVRMMDMIARETESYLYRHRPKWDWLHINPLNPVQDSLGHVAHELAEDLGVKAVCAFSPTGGTALFLSKGRTFAPILAFSDNKMACRRMQMFWGVYPIYCPSIRNITGLRERARAAIRTLGFATHGERFLMVSGTDFGMVGGANSLEICQVDSIG